MKLAILGDVHGHWNQFDEDFFNKSDYDAILFVGDLRSYIPFFGKNPHTNIIHNIKKPIYMALGNWDGINLTQIVGEIKNIPMFANLGRIGQHSRLAKLMLQKENLYNTPYTSYNLNKETSLIIGRPHSMGGKKLAFQKMMLQEYGIGSMEDSIQRYKSLIEQSQKRIIFLSHNGPRGLGKDPDSIFGCDFLPEGGDWGDYDLSEAIKYAKSVGKNILASVSGHMHERIKSGARRKNRILSVDQTFYINAARVPRIYKTGKVKIHHHISLDIQGENPLVIDMEIMNPE